MRGGLSTRCLGSSREPLAGSYRGAVAPKPILMPCYAAKAEETVNADNTALLTAQALQPANHGYVHGVAFGDLGQRLARGAALDGLFALIVGQLGLAAELDAGRLGALAAFANDRRFESPAAGSCVEGEEPRLHAVALKYLLAGTAQSGAVLLQTLLNREIIRQLLSAEAICISPAGRLLLRCALVTLRKRKRRVERQQDDDSGCISHSGLPLLRTKTQCPSVSSLEEVRKGLEGDLPARSSNPAKLRSRPSIALCSVLSTRGFPKRN
jgi:hypothetical protein